MAIQLFNFYKINRFCSELIVLFDQSLKYCQCNSKKSIIIRKLNQNFSIKMTNVIKKVGSYRLTKCIGSGATSQVFQAMKQNDIQKFAIKMIRLNKITQNQKQQIHKQISLIKNISHPHIVKLYDNLQTANNFYLVFEYCEKGDLQKYLKKFYGQLIPEEAVQKIFFCIGDAVREIHSKGIVHRDIKLANILLKADLVIKLADFGFARQINEEEFMLKTYCGTPITMAPQILQGKYYDKKCDIWSLGIILFQLIYGSLPFAITEGYNKFVERVINQPLRIPSQPQMPQQFKQLLTKCLQKKPQKRYSIQEFMASEWIMHGKDKKLQDRKIQVENQVTQLIKTVAKQVDKEVQQEQIEKNKILEYNTAEKLYNLLKVELQKILESHIQVRQQIYEKINNIKSANDISPETKDDYTKLQKLVFYLDFKYLNFLKQMKIIVTKEGGSQQIHISDINNLDLPQYLYTQKSKQPQQPQQLAFGKTISEFLNLQSLDKTQTSDSFLQKKRQRYQFAEKFLPMIRRFQLVIEVMFAHHNERREINLENVINQFKEMGKHISESTIQQEKNEQNQDKRNSQNEQKQIKYDKYANFITISMQCKETDEKLKIFRQNLKQTCQKVIDQISKVMQGYFS